MRRDLTAGVGAVMALASSVLTAAPMLAAVPQARGSGSLSADFNGDGFADLAIGVPLEDFAATDDGGVNVIYGTSTGLNAAGNQFWSQNSAGIFGSAESGDEFGLSLAAADFGHSGQADLAIGVPLEDFAATNDGGVNVIYGTSTGMNAAGSQFWSQNSAGIFGSAESGDEFGLSLAAAEVP
jgi:hypothetical protein